MMKFLLLCAAVFSMYVLATGSLADFFYYWLVVGLVCFVLVTIGDFFRMIDRNFNRDKIELHQHNYYTEERHPDPTIPDWPVVEQRKDEILPFLIEQKRRHKK